MEKLTVESKPLNQSFIRETTRVPNFMQIGSHGASRQMGKILGFFKLDSPAGQTPRRIFTRDGSSDAV